MIWIRRIKLINWLRYAGDNEIELEPKVYAISAEREDDPDRSNFLGKTSLLEAIRFALFGHHRHDREDDWITHGQNAGAVTIELSDGAVIKRERKRGKSTQLTVVDGKLLAKDAAQAHIEELIGMGELDSVNTWYFAQRELARVVLQTPADRMETVGAWLELGPLQRCEERQRDVLRCIADELREHRARLSTSDRMILEIGHHHGVFEGEGNEFENNAASVVHVHDSLVEQLEADRAHLNGLRAEVGKLGQNVERAEKHRRAHEMALRFDAVDAEGRQLAKELPAVWDADKDPDRQLQADGLWRAAIENIGKVRQDLDRKRLLARGRFDGVCPVGECPCPIADDLNARREENVRIHAEAAERFAVLQDEAIRLKADSEAIDERKRERDRIKFRMQDLAAEHARLKPAKDLIDEIGEPPTEAEDDDGLRGEETATAVRVDGLERDLRRLDAILSDRNKSAARVVELTERLKVAQQAAWIFGRDGAQRLAAERALGQIERGANARLRTCEIDLSVQVRWGRTHSSKLADRCDCGAGFDAGRKVKECPDCGAARAPKVIPRLDVVLSDRSGAADDLGGAAFQLAASDWLRTRRGASWGVACVDEPVAQCDARHREQLGKHLAAMLGGSFRQAFVVSHDRAFSEMMPGRIVVHADDERSWLEVA